MPGNSRWSARILRQKRRKLERQGPSIAAWISCSKYPQRYCWSYGPCSDATCMSRRNGKEVEGLQEGKQPRQGGGLKAACNNSASTDHCYAIYWAAAK